MKGNLLLKLIPVIDTQILKEGDKGEYEQFNLSGCNVCKNSYIGSLIILMIKIVILNVNL